MAGGSGGTGHSYRQGDGTLRPGGAGGAGGADSLDLFGTGTAGTKGSDGDARPDPGVADATGAGGGGGGGGGAGVTGGAGGQGGAGPVSGQSGLVAGSAGGAGGTAAPAAGGKGGDGGDGTDINVFSTNDSVGAGGGGGGAHGYVGAIIPNATTTGGKGGNGGDAASLGAGGGGGAGGDGAVVIASGPVGTLTHAVTGGAGGSGGGSTNGVGGNGGTGGIGLYFTNPSGATATIGSNATVQGGAGGAGTSGGSGGASGAGIVGTKLNLALAATAKVAGGSGADAITFLGGANSLALYAGDTTNYLSGNIGSSGSGTTLTISSAVAGGTILRSAITGTTSLTVQGGNTLTLAAANSYTGDTTVAVGNTLQVGTGVTTGSLSSSTFLTVSGTLAFDRADLYTLGNTLSDYGTVDQIGSGTLKVTGNTSNFQGTYRIDAGTLELATANGAGYANTIFGTGAATLQLDSNGPVYRPVSGFGLASKLDFAALQASGATVSYTAQTSTLGALTVSGTAVGGGTATDTFQINAAPTGYQYTLSADSAGHALVALALAPPPAPPTFTTPGAGSSTKSRTISGTGVSGDRIDYSVFIGGVGSSGSTTVTNGVWSFMLPSSAADGAYTVTAQQTNPSSGVKSASASETFTLDTTAPAAPVILGDSAAVYGYDGTSYVNQLTDISNQALIGTAEPNSIVMVSYGGQTHGSVQATGAGTWSYTLGTLPDGTYNFTATATDAAGNTSGASNSLPITVDTTIPTPVLTFSAANSAAGAGTINADNAKAATYTLSNIASDATAMLSIFGVSKGGGGLVERNANVTNGTDSVNLSHFQDGQLVAQVTETDRAGNTSTTSVSFNLDTTAPSRPTTPVLVAGQDTGVSSTDGITSVAALKVTGTADAGAAVVIYADDATQVGSGVAGSDGTYTITTSALADGRHALYATSTDAAGNRLSGASGFLYVTVETAIAPPSAPVLAGPPNGGLVNTKTPTLTGTAAPLALVTLYEGNDVLGTTYANAAGVYSVFPAAPLADGPHNLSVTASDAAGNVSARVPATLPILVQTAPPAAPSTPTVATYQGDGFTNDSTPTISGTGATGTTVTLYRDEAIAIGSTIVGSDGTYTITPTTALTDGRHALYTTATDPFGNVSVGVAGVTYVTIDTVAPVLPSAPAIAGGTRIGSDVYTSVAKPSVSGTAEVGATINLYADDAVPLGSALVGADGTYAITSSVALADGRHIVYTTATDAAGNRLHNTAAVTYVDVQTVLPSASAPLLAAGSDTGVPGDGITAQRAPDITGTTVAGATVTLYDSDGTSVLGTATAAPNGVYKIACAPLGDGAHTLTVMATDSSGTVGPRSDATKITIDASAPGAPTLNLADDAGASVPLAGTTADSTPTFAGTAEANSTVSFYRDGAVALGSTKADANGAYTFTPTAPIDDGSHLLYATATDAAGNTSGPGLTYATIASGLNAMVEAMATMGSRSSGTMSQTAPSPSQDAPTVAGSHG